MAEDEGELPKPLVPVQQTPRGNTRREILKKAGGVGIALLTGGKLQPLLKEESQQGRPEKAEDMFGIEWSRLYSLCDEIQKGEKDSHHKEVISDIKRNLELLENNFNSRMGRLGAFEEAASSDRDSDGTPRLYKLYKQMLGNFAELKPEDVIPFLVEKKVLLDRMESLKFLLESTREHQQGLLSKRDFDKNIGVLRWQTASQFVGKELKDKYTYVRDFVAYSNVLTHRESFTDDKKVNYEKKVSIEIHPGLKTTPEGMRFFEEDKGKIEKFLGNFPYFKKIFATIRLYSQRYIGKGPSETELGGWFFTEKEYGERHYRTEVAVVMDSSLLGEYLPEVIFAHEAFGHALDVEINEGLQDRLSPQQYIERLVFQHQILENSDWGDNDKDIPGLFKRDPVHRSDYSFVRNKATISTSEFRGIITEYPRNLLLSNRFLMDYQFLDSGLPGYLENDPTYGDVPRFSSLSDERNRVYNTLDNFLEMYLPKLRSSAQQGNIRSKFLLWGIEHFRQEFGNMDFSWLRPDNAVHGRSQAWVWSEYCRVILLNAVTYHVFLNGVDELRRLVPREHWRDIEREIYESRRFYRAELLAEGVAYSYYFGHRLEEKPPYRVSLEHIASLVEST